MSLSSFSNGLAAAFLLMGTLAAQDARPAPAESKPAPQTSPAPKPKKTPAAPGKAAPKKSASPNYNVGEPAPPASGKPAAKPTAKGKTPSKRSARARTQKIPMSQRVDINSASKEELKKLPGILDAEADKIIAHRPYKGKEDLFIVAGLTGAQYFAIKDRVKAVPKATK